MNSIQFLLVLNAVVYLNGGLRALEGELRRSLWPARGDSPPIHSELGYRRIKGKYSVKEEVVKRVQIRHPCSLEATTVKVTFPGIKSEVLVSFLGYKEPNLIHVNRCKGTCRGNASSSNLACVPLRSNMKKIRMHLVTQVIGSLKKRDKVRELILEEHEECGCACLLPRTCPFPATFSNQTCSCICAPSPEMDNCFGYNRHWDDSTCACRTLSVPSLSDEEELLFPLEDDPHKMTRIGKIRKEEDFPPCGHCLECMNMAGISSVYRKIHGGSPLVKSWVLLSFSLTLILFLFGTSLHYWRKSQALLKSLRGDNEEDLSKEPSSIPLELLDHQINFDHNGDGTMAELFNTSVFIPSPAPVTTLLGSGYPGKDPPRGNGSMPSAATQDKPRSSKRERKRQRSMGKIQEKT